MKKYDTPHRRRVVKTRLTEEEYASFSEMVSLCKMSQSEFIRQAITKSRIRPVITVSQVKKFCSRIATGDYDAVIIGHSQFEKIPLSPERQAAIIERQIDEIETAIAMRAAGGGKLENNREKRKEEIL